MWVVFPHSIYTVVTHDWKEAHTINTIDYIITLLNLKREDIAKCDISTVDDTVHYNITLIRKPKTCPVCSSPMIGHGHKLKLINHPALRDHKGIIRYNANRYICKICGKTAFEDNPFSISGFNSSYLLLQNAMKLLGDLNYNLTMISDELNISTTQLSRYLDSYVVIPPRPLPESLGIDEIHSKALSKKNSSYICVLVDNRHGSLYEVLNSRSKTDISLYFSAIPREERLKVKYVTIDMWQPYKAVVKTYLPNAIVAVDPFHVVKHLVHDFEKLRISLMKQCEYGSNAYYLLKKWGWLLVKDDVNLDNPKVFNHRFNQYLNKRDLFNMIMNTFPSIFKAYNLKEEYRYFNRYASYEQAVERFDLVLGKFKASGIYQYEEFSDILITWREEILNSFKRPYGNRKLSNSASENINGKIRSYLSISRGVSNFQRFRKRALLGLSKDIRFTLRAQLHSESMPKPKRGPYNKPLD